jgi:hypothetical protein
MSLVKAPSSIRIFHLAFHEFGAFVQRHAQAEAALQQALV